jgi:hypothetical protein
MLRNRGRSICLSFNKNELIGDHRAYAMPPAALIVDENEYWGTGFVLC